MSGEPHPPPSFKVPSLISSRADAVAELFPRNPLPHMQYNDRLLLVITRFLVATSFFKQLLLLFVKNSRKIDTVSTSTLDCCIISCAVAESCVSYFILFTENYYFDPANNYNSIINNIRSD